MTIYQMAAKANGFADREILLKFDCLAKNEDAQVRAYYTTRTETDELRLIRIMQRVWEGISKEVSIPHPSWKCPNCQHRQACNEWFLNGGDE